MSSQLSACAQCGSKTRQGSTNTTLLACARCKSVAYCCAEHQKAHWATHKAACNAAPKSTTTAATTAAAATSSSSSSSSSKSPELPEALIGGIQRSVERMKVAAEDSLRKADLLLQQEQNIDSTLSTEEQDKLKQKYLLQPLPLSNQLATIVASTQSILYQAMNLLSVLPVTDRPLLLEIQLHILKSRLYELSQHYYLAVHEALIALQLGGVGYIPGYLRLGLCWLKFKNYSRAQHAASTGLKLLQLMCESQDVKDQQAAQDMKQAGIEQGMAFVLLSAEKWLINEEQTKSNHADKPNSNTLKTNSAASTTTTTTTTTTSSTSSTSSASKEIPSSAVETKLESLTLKANSSSKDADSDADDAEVEDEEDDDDEPPPIIETDEAGGMEAALAVAAAPVTTTTTTTNSTVEKKKKKKKKNKKKNKEIGALEAVNIKAGTSASALSKFDKSAVSSLNHSLYHVNNTTPYTFKFPPTFDAHQHYLKAIANNQQNSIASSSTAAASTSTTSSTLSGITISYDEKKGRGIVANRNFNTGDIVLMERPLFSGNIKKNYCPVCFHQINLPSSKPNQSLFKCLEGHSESTLNNTYSIYLCREKCRHEMYCSPICSEYAWKHWHEGLCGCDISSIQIRADVDSITASSKIPLLITQIFGKLIILLHQRKIQRLLYLTGQSEERVEEETDLLQLLPALSLQMSFSSLPASFLNKFKLDFEQFWPIFDLLREKLNLDARAPTIDYRCFEYVYGICLLNSFGLYLNDEYSPVHEMEKESSKGGYATGIGELASLFNHSCFPNCTLDHSVGKNNGYLIFKATRHIKKGEDIHISYINAENAEKKHRATGLLQYGFVCQCSKCKREVLPEETKELLATYGLKEEKEEK